MNANLARATTAALFAILTLAGCSGGGAKSSDSEPAAAAPSAAAPGGYTLPAGLDDGPRASTEPVDAARAEVGEKLFQTKGCTACHAFGKKATGPDLAGVSERRTTKWIEAQILHPDAMTKQDPIARELFAKHALQMPKQGLTEEEAAAVIEYLKHENR